MSAATPMTVEFRRLDRADFPLLAVWLDQEHVVRWWPEAHDPAALEAHYGPTIDGVDPTEVFVVLYRSHPIGLIQRYRVDDYSDWAATLRSAGVTEASAGIDYLIGDPELIGVGLGPEMIAAFIHETWARYPELPQIAVAVQQANRRSWRALEKCGFRRVYAGMIESDDPGDAGPSFLYVAGRPNTTGSGNDREHHATAG